MLMTREEEMEKWKNDESRMRESFAAVVVATTTATTKRSGGAMIEKPTITSTDTTAATTTTTTNEHDVNTDQQIRSEWTGHRSRLHTINKLLVAVPKV